MTKAIINEKWVQILEKYKASELTPTQFSKSEGVALRQLYYWLSKESLNEKLKSTPTKWIPVELEHKNQLSTNKSLQIKIGHAEIEVKPGFDREHLLDVLTTLRALC